MSKIKDSLTALFDKHDVVFWIDNEEQLRDDYDGLAIDGVTKYLVDRNEWGIKHTIYSRQQDDKLLIYLPMGNPEDKDNWLLDLQLAHKTFRTDRESMAMQELGLDYRYRDFVSEHIAFFDSKDRVAALARLVSDGDAEADIRRSMMAVVLRARGSTLDYLIPRYAAAFLAGDDQKTKDMDRFNLSSALWQEAERAYGYVSESPSIYGMVCHVFSQVFSLTMSAPHRAECAIFLSRWQDSVGEQESYRSIAYRVAIDQRVSEALDSADLDTIVTDDLFKEVDLKIIHTLSTILEDDVIDYDRVRRIIQQRQHTYWYESEYKHLYGVIEHAVELMPLIAGLTDADLGSITEVTALYASSLYRIDFHYRKAIYYYHASQQNRILQPLYDLINRLYINEWLLTYGDRWQQIVDDLDVWPTASSESQRSFYRRYVDPIVREGRRVFVIISDALRYECGYELCHKILQQNRFDATPQHMIGSLPSYTQLGMASLLPHDDLHVVEGDCTVTTAGLSTVGTAGRTKVLQEHSGVRGIAIQASDLMKMNSKSEGRAFAKEHDVIYVYTNRIDAAGDDTTSEERVFQAVEDEINYISTSLLAKIANVNGNTVLITADHGFIYQDVKVEESDYSDVSPVGTVWKRNRRFVIGAGLSEDRAMKSFSGPCVGLNPEVDVMIAKGARRLRVKGAGSRYVHGGASLQEIVIPVIQVKKRRVDTVSQVEVDIVKSRDKITTNLLTVTFLQQERVAGSVLPRVIKASLQAPDGTLLSDVFKHTFDKEQDLYRERSVRYDFTISAKSAAYRNQVIHLVLEEPIPDTSEWRPYKKFSYTLLNSFTGDFD